jgi:glyoxylase-like metal-dependent hydrolase (beta-lactamase superfamily II)
MQITPSLHALRLPFSLPAGPGGMKMERFVNVFLYIGRGVMLFDAGVATSPPLIFEYLEKIGRSPGEISWLMLTHAHPDHIGGAREIAERTGCQVAASAIEQPWIEDPSLQMRERPVPGFEALVGGPVRVDAALAGVEEMDLTPDLHLQCFPTPGHSKGSLSFFVEEEGALICGDALPVPHSLPIYEDASVSLFSLGRLAKLPVKVLLSAWDEPRTGDAALEAIRASARYIQEVHTVVLKESAARPEADPLALAPAVLAALGLPPAYANPLTATTIGAHLRLKNQPRLMADWAQ